MPDFIEIPYTTITEIFEDEHMPTCIESAERTWCEDEREKPMQLVTFKLRPGTRDRSEGFSDMLRSYANDLSARLGIQSRIPCRIHYVSPST